MHAEGKEFVHPSKNAVLLVDHPWTACQERRRKGRNRWITAKAHHDGGPVDQHPGRRPQHPTQNSKRHRHLGQHPTARKGGRAGDHHLNRLRKAARIARAARIGRQLHPPATRNHGLGQRLGRKHVPPGAARCNQQQAPGHLRLRKRSLIWPCGRLRVRAKSIPTVMPAAITEEPP